MINVHIRNKFVDYKFNLWQKYNLLTGDSGEGKTTLYKMIASYDENKQNIQCLGYKKLGTDLTLLRTLADIAMEDDDKVKEDLIHRLDGFLIILDENSSLLKRRSAPSLLERFNCYFLVICRKVALGFKSVSADCVFELSSSGKFHTFKPHYKLSADVFLCHNIICEDSKSGMQFMQSIFDRLKISYAQSSNNDREGGKAKFVSFLKNYTNCDVCIVFDRAGIGYDLEGILMQIERQRLHACFIDWDSFETYILESPAFRQTVPEPECNYESKEKLATKLLSDLIHYGKDKLPACLSIGRQECYRKIDGSGSYYKFEDLIYWKIKKLFDLYEASNKFHTSDLPDKMNI